ncbi:DsbA family oxidoreductase [Streptomyces sp. NPDC015220]|uniref:DsbA family oxidoreductase n=1 Tax=Streptomyces sp. NPDC015220 TaxID=3364947 RepID=UPI0036F59264
MKIEIFSDILCPWCYVGKRRIQTALDLFGHQDEAEVLWRSYELGPEAEREPGPTAAKIMETWMDPAAVPARVAQIKGHGRQEGLELNMHLSRPVNSFDAHRLTHLAAARGVAGEMVERLLRAYHTEALIITDHDVLVRLAEEAGLDAAETREVLAGDAYADDVRADQRRARELGVCGVPSVVIDGRPPVSGVMDPAALAELLESARSHAAHAGTAAGA